LYFDRLHLPKPFDLVPILLEESGVRAERDGDNFDIESVLNRRRSVVKSLDPLL
jgi:hypothetical protein